MPAFSLEWLIDPIAPEVFRDEYWERRPLVIKRANKQYYGGLFSLADADCILSASPIKSSQIRSICNGREIPLQTLPGDWIPGNAASHDSLYAEYRNGGTIVFQFIHERWEPLRNLCASLSVDFSAFLQVNAYLTPESSQGLNVHYDIHDVFVLQTEGHKHWRIYGDPVLLPGKDHPFSADTCKPGRMIEEFDLEPGDLIYIPRGYMHDAESRAITSLHLTLGINTLTWGAVALKMLERAIEQDLRFRESLPLGFAIREPLRKQAAIRIGELLDVFAKRADPEPPITDAAQAVLSQSQQVYRGHLSDLQALPRLNVDTQLSRRGEILFQLTTSSTTACLCFFGKSICFPDYIAPQLQFITKASRFTAADMPDGLDEPGKLVLLETLIREGFLAICETR